MMRMGAHRPGLLFAAALSLAGCVAGAERTPYGPRDVAEARLLQDTQVRYWADSPATAFEPWRQALAAARADAAGETTLLAISGGSDKGAFAAGLLVGWTQTRARPQFTIVTGVSTGALIAPFAFLGSAQDEALRELYTGIDSDDIYSLNVLGGLLGGASLLDTGPLEALIARHVTPDLLTAIAREHAAGRRLLVMTTNLDAQRGAIWDMGAIASSDDPRAPALFRRVLLASASIPGAFPPVMIDAEIGGRSFSEMHVDGGVTSGFLALPRSALLASGGVPLPAQARIHLLYNGRIDPHFEVVEPETFGIISRALSTALTEADRTMIAELRAFTETHDIGFSLCAIESDFKDRDADLFEPDYMRSLFDYGMHRAAQPDGCLLAK